MTFRKGGKQVQELIWSRNRVQVWLSSCIVTSSPAGTTRLLVPANERLCGTQFPYFPRGGPTPAAAYIGEKCAQHREATEILYGYECIDGLVSDFGGPGLEKDLAKLPRISGCEKYYIKCNTGEARLTGAGDLSNQFPGGLIHTVAPFFGTDRWQDLLSSAYASAFRFLSNSHIMASPLLGAGCRGAPLDDAIRLAASSAQSSGLLQPALSSKCDGILRFVLQEASEAHSLVTALEDRVY